MKIKVGFASCAALFASSLILVPALAYTVTEREKQSCQVDYHNYCGEYGLGSEALRACMSRNIKKVSHVCVSALVAAGEMTQAQADKLRGKGKVTKKSTHKKAVKKTTHKRTTPYKGTKKKR
jgi:hypothetical protein